MRVIGLNCSNCGAVLQVARKAEYATCAFCDARLKIERTENTVFAQTLEAIDERTQEIAKELAALKRRSALDRLDRAWEDRRKQYMVKGQDGHYAVPSKGLAAVIGVVAVAAGVVLLGAGSLIGLVVAIVGGLFALFHYSKAREYETAYRDYRRQRRKVVRGDAGR